MVDEPDPTKVIVGSQLSRYLLLERIASGGMGTVYFGIDTSTLGHVAVKRIHPHLVGEPMVSEMFRDEAAISLRLEHPNICTTLDFDIDDSGAPYLVLEYLHGVSLAKCFGTGCDPASLAPARRFALAAYIIARAADGLHHAHELTDTRGAPLHIIHRDVSPQNIMVCRDGRVKVVDFGIARADERQHETRTGQLKGKIAYMAPEQTRQHAALDRRVDVWALGVVLWEALTGKGLFRRSNAVQSLFALINEPLVSPSSVVSEVPLALDHIVAGALQRDPDARYATARGLAADLDTWLAASGIAMDQTEVGAWMALSHPELDHSTAYLGGLESNQTAVTRVASHFRFDVSHGPHHVAIAVDGRMSTIDDARSYQARIERELRDRPVRGLVMDNRMGTGASPEAYACMWQWIQDRGGALFDRLAFVVESPSLVRGINATGLEYGVNTRAFSDYGQAIRWLDHLPGG